MPIEKAKYTEDFETFWKLYPRRVDKKAAYRRWQLALREATPEEIINGLKKQLEAKKFSTEERYIKHPEVWLNKGSWEDEVESISKPKVMNL